MAIMIRGTGIVSSSDYKNVVWSGKTKGGKAVSITLYNAINTSNINLSMVEKDDTVPQLTFEGTYSNTNYMASTDGDMQEPWAIAYSGSVSDQAAESIMLGAGTLSIGGVTVALTRGGSQFDVEREFREINADGDRGAVKGRVVMDASRPKLTMNILTFLVNMADFYSAVSTT